MTLNIKVTQTLMIVYCKEGELGQILILNTNSKLCTCMVTPTVPSELTLSDMQRSKSSSRTVCE